MKFNFFRKGLSLLEIVFVVFCFLFAIVPIASLFSFSTENVRVLHRRSLTYTAAVEVFNQIQIIPPAELPDAYCNIPAQGGSFTAFLVEPGTGTFHLSPLPQSFNRVVESYATGTPTRHCLEIRMGEQNENKQLELAWKRTFVYHGGGRQLVK
jgi:hypothetical protein